MSLCHFVTMSFSPTQTVHTELFLPSACFFLRETGCESNVKNSFSKLCIVFTDLFVIFAANYSMMTKMEGRSPH